VAERSELTSERTDKVVNCNPLKNAFLFARQNTRALWRQDAERVDRRVAHQWPDEWHYIVHLFFQQLPHPCTTLSHIHNATSEAAVMMVQSRPSEEHSNCIATKINVGYCRSCLLKLLYRKCCKIFL